MATAYRASAVSILSTGTATGIPAIESLAGGVCAVSSSFTIPAAGLIINDTIDFFQIPATGPAKCTLMNIYVTLPDLDTGGSALRVSIGDTGAAGRYITTSTSFDTAIDNWISGIGNGFQAQSLPRAYTAADTIIFKVTTAATTSPTSGTMTMMALYAVGAGQL